MADKQTVFVVDDDEAVRESLKLLLAAAGYAAQAFSSARAFLERQDDTPAGCVLVDVRMPDMGGLELQEELAKKYPALPVIIMTGHGDVPLAVRAMKAGAIDFLEKPFNRAQLLGAVERSLAAARTRTSSPEGSQARKKLAGLTQRERGVFDLLVAGHQNKHIAHALSISPRTVQVHRGHVMHKLGIQSLQELVRLAMAAKDK